MAELIDIGTSELTEGGVIWAQCKGAPLDDDDASPDFGKAAMMCSLGHSHRPYPADERGNAQGIAEDVAGLDGAVIAAHDPRAAAVYGEIGPGEGAHHTTGPSFDSRALAKDQLYVILVGDNYVISVDRKAKKIAINSPAGIIQLAEDSGITVLDATGSAGLRVQGGVASLIGQTVLGGANPSAPVADGTKVDAEFARIWQMLSAWVPAPMDGGAALKTLAGTFGAQVQSVKASGVFLGT